MKLLALCNMDYFGAQYLHLRCGWQTPFPMASHDSLPCHTHGSVTTCWLDFGRTGLPGLPIFSELGALISSPSCFSLSYKPINQKSSFFNHNA